MAFRCLVSIEGGVQGEVHLRVEVEVDIAEVDIAGVDGLGEAYTYPVYSCVGIGWPGRRRGKMKCHDVPTRSARLLLVRHQCLSV